MRPHQERLQHDNPRKSEAAQKRDYEIFFNVVASLDRRRCPACGRNLAPGKRPGEKCSDGRCQERRGQRLSVRNDEHQRSNVSTRRKLLPNDSGIVAISKAQSQPRSITAADEKAVEGIFWSSYLPLPSQDGRSIANISQSKASYRMLLDITAASPLVKRCATAVAFANLGRENGDRRLNMRGAQIYDTVLRQARDLVAAGITTIQQRDDLLACCLVMCTYELLRDDTEPGSWYFGSYNNHVKGLCQVLRSLKVSDEPSISIQYAWQEARYMAGRAALFLRQPVLGLDRPAYRPSKTPNQILCDDMLDHLFELVQWLAQIDKVTRRTDGSASSGSKEARNVIASGLGIGKSLIAWEERAIKQYCDDRRPSLYSMSFSADGELLNTLTHHWMICMLLHAQLKVFIAHRSLRDSNLELPDWINAWPYALFIVVVGPLFSHPRFGIWSALAAHTPMIATIFYFSATGNFNTPEAQDLREFVENKHRPGNSLLRKFFRGLFGVGHVFIPQGPMVQAGCGWFGVQTDAPWKVDDEPKE